MKASKNPLNKCMKINVSNKCLKNRLFTNAAWIIICKAIQSLLNFFITILSALYLGPSNYGIIAYVSSVIAFITPIAQLGFNSVLVQEIINEPNKDGEILGSTLMTSTFSSIICIFISIISVSILNHGERDTIIVTAIYSLSMLFQSLEMVQYWFQAKLLSKYTSIVSLIAYVIVSIYKVFLLVTHKNVYWFALAYSIDSAFISIALICIYKKKCRNFFTCSFKRIKSIWNNSKHYIIPGLMVTVFTQTDRIMLKLLLDSSSAGYYSAAVTCAGITGFVINAVVDSARPVIFENIKINKAKFEKSVINLYSVSIYFCLIQSAVTTLFAEFIINLVYGPEYEAAISALKIVTWYVTFACIGTIRNIWMLAEGKQKYLVGVNLFGGISNVVLNSLLIPVWGINGAAFASLLSQSLTNVGMGFIITPIKRNNILMIKALNPKYIINLYKSVFTTSLIERK